MAAYYNEIDPHAVAWLRELIKLGEIPDGKVDTRSIRDVRPSDLTDFIQGADYRGEDGIRILGIKCLVCGECVPHRKISTG